jgi:hypothetical protein
MFSSSIFRVSGVALKALTYFELIFVQGEMQGSSFSLLHCFSVFPTPFVEEQRTPNGQSNSKLQNQPRRPETDEWIREKAYILNGALFINKEG